MNQRPTYERLVDFHRRFKSKRHFARGYSFGAVSLNVALLILGFYILNSHLVLQPGVRIELPDAPFSDGIPFMQSTIVTITRDGTLYCNDERTAIDQLAAQLTEALLDNPEATLLIQADKRVQYGQLVAIYNQAQAAGIERIIMATHISALAGEQP
jgi:biopolymer transport protein ExbD